MPEQKEGQPSVQIILSPALEAVVADIIAGKQSGDGPKGAAPKAMYSFFGLASTCCS